MTQSTIHRCWQLNSEKIKEAKLCYLSPLRVEKYSTVSAKYVCHVDNYKKHETRCARRETLVKSITSLVLVTELSTQETLDKDPKKKLIKIKIIFIVFSLE